MKNHFFCFSLIMLILFLQGCRTSGMDWGWKAERPQKIQDVFSHANHEKAFKKEGFDCSACHPMNFLIQEEEEKKMHAVSKEVFFPGKQTCHFCHFNPKSLSNAPGQCSLCHFDLLSIQPPNHQFDWGRKHSVYSKADTGKCETCHLAKFCEDCHQRRDLATERVHDRNFRLVHGMEARVNPTSCGNCHERVSFCDECHIEGGYER